MQAHSRGRQGGEQPLGRSENKIAFVCHTRNQFQSDLLCVIEDYTQVSVSVTILADSIDSDMIIYVFLMCCELLMYFI